MTGDQVNATSAAVGSDWHSVDRFNGYYVRRRRAISGDHDELVLGPWRYYRDGVEITQDEYEQGVAR